MLFILGKTKEDRLRTHLNTLQWYRRSKVTSSGFQKGHERAIFKTMSETSYNKTNIDKNSAHTYTGIDTEVLIESNFKRMFSLLY